MGPGINTVEVVGTSAAVAATPSSAFEKPGKEEGGGRITAFSCLQQLVSPSHTSPIVCSPKLHRCCRGPSTHKFSFNKRCNKNEDP